MAHAQTVADLESKNKRLLSEIDKIQTQNFEFQNEITALKEALTERRHNEQLAGWAMDRALEFAKNLSVKPQTIKELTDIAREICDGVKSIAPDVDIPEKVATTDQQGTIQ